MISAIQLLALLLGTQYPFRIANLTSVQLIDLDAETTVQEDNGGKDYEVSAFHSLLRGFRESGVNLGLSVVVTPRATPSEFQHALAFDLSCFTSFRGCRTLCQMMPLALQDAIQKGRIQGLLVPEVFEKEGELPACSEAYNADR
ncbi:MAG: hypothetical protein WCD47_12205 [Candidatus Sulfotelmatobacter sp.]